MKISRIDHLQSENEPKIVKTVTIKKSTHDLIEKFKKENKIKEFSPLLDVIVSDWIEDYYKNKEGKKE